MIQTELSLGNYVTVRGYTAIVLSIDHNGIMYDALNETGPVAAFAEWPHVKGIPVTGPNLRSIKMTRFDEKSEYWEKYKNDKGFCVSISLHNEPSAGVEIGKAYSGYEFTELKFIHQVQNLMKFK